MIDATSFATSYSAFWNDYTPTCEHFIRRLNLDGFERTQPPMPKSRTIRRALISEYAFSLFVERMSNFKSERVGDDNSTVEEMAWLATERRLMPYTYRGLELNRNFDESDHWEVNQISERLYIFFGNARKKCVLRPVFAGCGYIDESEADILLGETIYEVKTVDRPFRSNDIRQVITYAALNFSSGQFSISNIGLYNPRRGQHFEIPLDQICSEISGRPAQELLRIVIQTISSGEVSR